MSDGSPPAHAPPAGPTEAARERRRVFALFLAVLALSVAQASVLIGIPLIVLVLAIPTRRIPGLVAGAIAALLAFGWAPRDALWYAERGWAILLAGWFAAVTIRWPRASFFPRALGSVGGALAVTLLVLSSLAWGAGAGEGVAGPFQALDSLVSERARAGADAAARAFQILGRGTDDPGAQGSGEPVTEEPLAPALASTMEQAAELQVWVYPALLALSSLAALGVAWWIYLRFGRGTGGALGPLREFRFNDHLVWLLISGMALWVAGDGGPGSGGGWARTGSNAVFFMGTLYAVRGAAVVTFMSGGLTLTGMALLLIGLLFVAPVVLGASLIIGLGDTWLDLRGRTGEESA